MENRKEADKIPQFKDIYDFAQKGNVAIVAVGNAGCLGHAICEVLAQEHVGKVHVAVISEVDFLDLKEHKSDIESLVLMRNDLTIQRLSVDDLIPERIQYERNDIKQKEKQLSQQGWKRNGRKFRRI